MWRRVRYAMLLVGLCAIATCPAANRSCTARARAREADQLTEYLADRVERALADGHLPAAAGPTPVPACCDRDDGICEPDPTAWATPQWQALGFSIDGPHRFTYSYTPSADGRSAVVRAVGDTDCNGEQASYEIELTATANGIVRTQSHRNRYE